MRRDLRASGFGRRSAGEAERQASPVTAQKERGAAHGTAAADPQKKSGNSGTVPPAVGRKGFELHELGAKLPPRAVDGAEEKKLSRRRHQEGQLIELKTGWAIRLYEDYRDANGIRQRRRVQKYLGDFKTLPTLRAAQNAMDAELVLVNDYSRQPKTTITFRQQAARWMADCKKRSWKPVKPGVIEKRQSALNNHVLPLLGDLPLCDVKNGAMRILVEQLFAKGLKASTAQTSIQVVKAVVASAEDADGNLLCPVTWNRKLAPTINPAMQNRPTFTTNELQKLVNASKGNCRCL